LETLEAIPQIEPDSKSVGFLGTLHPKVDVQALVDISALPSVSEMVVIGDGVQRGRLEQIAENRASLRVTGRVPDEEAFRTLAESQVLVNPQIPSPLQRSSSPVKLFYYAALGRAMVVTEGPTVVKDLSSNEAAVAVGPEENFVTAVERVLSNVELAERLANNAESVATSFRWSNRVGNLLQIYQELDLENGNNPSRGGD
jgi:glycosyltransferase involved in cell wall biosynthesis